MSPTAEVAAAAASNAYQDRLRADVDQRADVTLNDQKYKIFGYKDDPATGSHATAYQNVATGEMIISYRDWRNHARTTV
jgi:hypothetical protein